MNTEQHITSNTRYTNTEIKAGNNEIQVIVDKFMSGSAVKAINCKLNYIDRIEQPHDHYICQMGALVKGQLVDRRRR